jgi:hypothetical protein
MSTYRIEWECCGSVTETVSWEPDACPVCTRDELRVQVAGLIAERDKLLNDHDIDMLEYHNACVESAQRGAEAERLRNAIYTLDRELGHDDRDDDLRERIISPVLGGQSVPAAEPVARVRIHTTGGNAGIAWSGVPIHGVPTMRDGEPLYAAPQPTARTRQPTDAELAALIGAMPIRPPIDIEQMIRECVPGGSVCDPQAVADAIREYARGVSGVVTQRDALQLLTDEQIRNEAFARYTVGASRQAFVCGVLFAIEVSGQKGGAA